MDGTQTTKKILVIVGPTATGKTDLALNLASKFDCELIACDSRQVYRNLDIGTGKLPAQNVETKKDRGIWEIQGIKIWLYDLVDPMENFNAHDWAKQALRVIREIEQRGKLPIVIGGTGFYLTALLNGFDSPVGANWKLRKKLESLALVELQSRVATLSPGRWDQLNYSDQNNPRRLIRIMEQISMYGYTGKIQNSKLSTQNYNIFKIGLTAPRSWLNSKIDQRVLDWFDQGIVLEVQNLLNRGVTKEKFKEFGLEYDLIARFLEGEIASEEELIKLIQTKIRQYAKRQIAWFKRDSEIKWYDVAESNLAHRVETEVRNWYNQR